LEELATDQAGAEVEEVEVDGEAMTTHLHHTTGDRAKLRNRIMELLKVGDLASGLVHLEELPRVMQPEEQEIDLILALGGAVVVGAAGITAKGVRDLRQIRQPTLVPDTRALASGPRRGDNQLHFQ
jgi:hypothetical protein